MARNLETASNETGDSHLYEQTEQTVCPHKGEEFHVTVYQRFVGCKEQFKDGICVMGYKSMGEFVDLEGTSRTPCPVSGLIPITKLEGYREK